MAARSSQALTMDDRYGEEGLEDIGIQKKKKKGPKVKQQHPCKGVCLRLSLTSVSFIDIFIIFSGGKNVDDRPFLLSRTLVYKGRSYT